MRNEKEYISRIGKNVKKFRLKKGLTQGQLADYCDLEKQHISRLELGGTSPTLKTLIKVANALEIELADLVKV